MQKRPSRRSAAPKASTDGGGGAAKAPSSSSSSHISAPQKGGKKGKGVGAPRAGQASSSSGASRPPSGTEQSEWTVAVRKGKPGGKSGGTAKEAKAPKSVGASTSPQAQSRKGSAVKRGGAKGAGVSSDKKNQPAAPKQRKIRPSKQAAVLISVAPVGEGETGTATNVSLGEAVAGIKGSIKLSDFGIASLKPKRAAAGGILYEVPGQESGAKADKLAEALKALLEPKGLRVTRPVKSIELRVSGLDDSATPVEVQQALAAAGSCSVREMLVGKPNRSPTGRLGSLWAKMPAAAAKKVIDAGPLTIGWIKTRVEVLGARSLQCYRCLGAGHTRATCKGDADRSGLCYRCGQADHRAAECSAQPSCPYCMGRGLKADHRYGGRACASLRPEKKRKGGEKKSPPQRRRAGADKEAAPPILERSMDTAPVPGPGESREEAMIVE